MRRRTPTVCARCRIPLPDPLERIYSVFTRNYYCVNVDACGERALRLPKDAA